MVQISLRYKHFFLVLGYFFPSVYITWIKLESVKNFILYLVKIKKVHFKCLFKLIGYLSISLNSDIVRFIWNTFTIRSRFYGLELNKMWSMTLLVTVMCCFPHNYCNRQISVYEIALIQFVCSILYSLLECAAGLIFFYFIISPAHISRSLLNENASGLTFIQIYWFRIHVFYLCWHRQHTIEFFPYHFFFSLQKDLK